MTMPWQSWTMEPVKQCQPLQQLCPVPNATTSYCSQHRPPVSFTSDTLYRCLQTPSLLLNTSKLRWCSITYLVFVLHKPLSKTKAARHLLVLWYSGHSLSSLSKRSLHRAATRFLCQSVNLTEIRTGLLGIYYKLYTLTRHFIRSTILILGKLLVAFPSSP